MSKDVSTSCGCNSNRRGFIKTAGLAGLALSGLPQIASAITGDQHHANEILKSKVVLDGKVKHITL
ncbi:MAG: twin-arginine translocation signal domain-containing protein, partial [Bacteroidetes bacterium]|nr:twin-arginine translocation signal domain-containing protein [Bacteroidota bacterium]